MKTGLNIFFYEKLVCFILRNHKKILGLYALDLHQQQRFLQNFIFQSDKNKNMDILKNALKWL